MSWRRVRKRDVDDAEHAGDFVVGLRLPFQRSSSVSAF